MIGIYIFGLSLIINMILVFIRKKSNFIATIHCLFIWILAVFSYDVVDYENYANSFKLFKTSDFGTLNSFEPGYYALCKVISNCGFDFIVARGIIITTALILLIIVARKIGSSPNFAVVLFTIYPLFIELIQIRTLLAMSFLSIGIVYGLAQKKKKVFFFWMLVASSIHISFLIYLIFLFYDITLSKKGRKILYFCFVLAICGGFYVGGRNFPFLKNILMLFGDSERFNFWLTSSGNLGFIFYCLLIMLAIYNSKLVYKNMDENTFYPEVIYKINVMSLCFVPLFMMASTFGRLISNISFVNYLLWDSSNFERKAVSYRHFPKYKILLSIGILLYLGLWFFLEIHGEFNLRVLLFFKNNTLLQWLER